jgi:uncharacterized membrane protein (UPF0127 family)
MNLSDASGSIKVLRDGNVLIERLVVAQDFKSRAFGLMFRKRIPEVYGDGLFFPNCRSLHTFNMRFALDIVFVDGEGQMVRCVRDVKPWRVVTGPRIAKHCFEIKAGCLPSEPKMTGKWCFEQI